MEHQSEQVFCIFQTPFSHRLGNRTRGLCGRRGLAKQPAARAGATFAHGMIVLQ